MTHHPRAVPSAWPLAGGHVAVGLVVGTLAHAGVARYVSALARTLAGGRHRVRVYALAGPIEPVAGKLQALGVPVTLLQRRRSYEPARVVGLARALRRDGIDLVHAILPAGAAYGALAARVAGVPVVVSTRAGDRHAEGASRPLLHRIYRGATAVVANTRAQARVLATAAGLPLERVQVVYDGVDLARHAPGVLDGLWERVWHRPLVIGGTGAAGSGPELFFATAGRIAARHPEAHFVWLEDSSNAGHAPEFPAGLPVRVVPVGDDPEPVLSQLALLCLAGAPECPSLDLVPIAMAAARPIVAAEVPGIEELVDGATGAVVPAGDAGAFADAAVALLEDRGRLRTAGHAARAHAERALGVETMARTTAAVYEASLIGPTADPVGGGRS